MLEKLKRWLESHPYWTLTFITLAALAPFLAKPFNIDDPLFIWAAQQIHAHPFDPYGFKVEWGWTEFPMWNVTENPPFTCYFIALAATVFGWSEIGLHLAFLLPAIALILGTYRLAKNFCRRPALAALVTLCAPVIMVSSLTVMCDVTMLAFWMWSVIFWTEGLAQKNFRKLAAAALLIAFAEMTKYYGVCLMPLLAAYSLASSRPIRQWFPFLLIPLAVLCAYQYGTHILYGKGLLYRAMDYASFSKTLYSFSKFQNGLIALTFTGGCVASAILFIPLLWHKRGLIMLAVSAILITIVVFSSTALWKKYGALQGASLTSAKIQMIFWATGGLCVLALAVADIFRQRDARSLLLFLWVIGTFIFTAFCNWTVNARSILPLAPAVAILVARRLEIKFPATEKLWPVNIIICLATVYGLAWAVTMSDFSIASAYRQSAQEICDKYGGGPGKLWFQGHWGFQYYMEQAGASAMDFKKPMLKPGDLLVVPANNSNILLPDPQKSVLLETFTIPGAQWLATWNASIGGGFYASAIAPLPFAFGSVPPEKVFIYGLKSPTNPSPNPK
jgi:4-amino-4-deoxy-L-arabinose transferase-like glycosyltransferase